MTTLPEYMRVKREKLARYRATLASGEAGPAVLTASCTVAGGSGVRPVRAREYTIITDSGPALAGYSLGPTAPEVLLSALASCLTHSYVAIAATRDLTYETIEVVVHGTVDYRGNLAVDPAAPIPPYDLSYEARIVTDADDATLAEIHAAVERLCPVLQALRQPLTVSGRLVRG